MEIRDGNSSASPLLKKLCYRFEDKPRVVSNGTSMFIRFHSDGIKHYRGFRAAYTMALRNTEGNAVAWPSPSHILVTILVPEDNIYMNWTDFAK